MKRIVIIFIVGIVSVATFNVFAQENFSADCLQAFTTANSAQLCAYLDVEVDLLLPEAVGEFSGSVACEKLNRFFKAHSVKSFQIVHEGLANTAVFLVGKLVTKNATYRVNMLMRERDNQMKIQQLRIEK